LKEVPVQRLLLAVALVACTLQAAAQAPPSSKSARAAATNGREVFMRLGCYTCHGTVGHGGAGPPLTPGTLPLAAFRQWVRNGTPGWSVANGMPAYSRSVLADEELADVREYLVSRPAPRAVEDIPLLND
jgi:ubiquinol-cytochrome c reductase cytochrome c subunit